MATPNVSQSPAVGDPYAALGVAPTATDAEIKQAYFAQVRAHPPESDPQAFKLIRAAYDRLRSPEKRLEADMLRVQAWPEPALPAGTQDGAGSGFERGRRGRDPRSACIDRDVPARFPGRLS